MSDVQLFDLRAEPHALAADEWSRHKRRDPAGMLGAALHSWGSKVGTEARLRRRYGSEAAALARRALAATYTISCGVTRDDTPVVAIAHPLERYTHASDAGNMHYLAIGVMGLFPFEEEERVASRHSVWSPGLQAALDRALEVAADLLGEHGIEAPELLVHRQCCNQTSDHFACPGELVVKMASDSPLVMMGHYHPRPDRILVPGIGKPWPAAWRRHFSARSESEQADAEGERLPPLDCA